MADCPSHSSYRIKLGPSPSTARAAQRWPAGVQAGHAVSVSPGCFLRILPAACLGSQLGACCRIFYFAEAQKVLSVHFAPAPFSAAASACTLLARLSGWASKCAGGRLAQHLSQQSPHGKPHGPVGTLSWALVPQPLHQLPHLFLCGQILWRAGVWATAGTMSGREGACDPRRAWGKQAPTSPAPTWGPQGTIWPRNSYGRDAGGSPHPLGPRRTPRLDPRQDHHLVRPAWVLNQIGCQLVPCTGPPEPVPTTGKV